MADVSLTPTSYLVLGLVAQFGPLTSYDLKRIVGRSIGYFWTFPHSQLYAEPARLVDAGLLTERQEETGRRRRSYTVTPAGRDAVCDWLAEPEASTTEIRDLAVLKLFFGSLATADDRRALAESSLAAHRARLAEYEAIEPDVRDEHQLATLRMGLAFERAAVTFWEELAGPGEGAVARYSHSMVPGGLEVTSYATRFTPGTSLMMRLDSVSRSS